MRAEHNTVVDGQTYKKGQEIPDLGTGSSATLIDPNGIEDTIIAKYYASTKQWLDMRGGVIV